MLSQQVWWYIPVIPATQEAEVGRSPFEAILGKVSMRPYLKNKLKQKRAGGMAQVIERACLARLRPGVQIPVPHTHTHTHTQTHAVTIVVPIY
jgi:hypothetical protein